jgi:hypothetical protein
MDQLHRGSEIYQSVWYSSTSLSISLPLGPHVSGLHLFLFPTVQIGGETGERMREAGARGAGPAWQLRQDGRAWPAAGRSGARGTADEEGRARGHDFFFLACRRSMGRPRLLPRAPVVGVGLTGGGVSAVGHGGPSWRRGPSRHGQGELMGGRRCHGQGELVLGGGGAAMARHGEAKRARRGCGHG